MKWARGFIVFCSLFFLGSHIVGPTRCADGWSSSSIGSRGACSYHGGVDNTPRNIVFIFSILGGLVASGFFGSRPIIKKRTELTEEEPSSTSEASTASKKSHAPRCPICGSPMVKRVSKRGQFKGSQFYGCRRYPRCMGTVNNGT